MLPNSPVAVRVRWLLRLAWLSLFRPVPAVATGRAVPPCPPRPALYTSRHRLWSLSALTVEQTWVRRHVAPSAHFPQHSR